MNKIRKLLDKVLEIVTCLMLTMMVIAVCWQVISRYVLGTPSTFTEELLRFALVWLSMLGMAYVSGKQQHISLTLFLDKASPLLRHIWMLILQVCFGFFAIYVLIIGGLQISSISMEQYSPALNMSMGHVYYALPLGGVLIIIYSVLNIVDSLRNMKALSGMESA